MTLKDMKIGTQLRLGLGAILVFVALLGAMAAFQAHSLWQATVGIYHHPFTIRIAIGDLSADILAIHQGMEDLFLADNDREKEEITKLVGAHDSDAIRQLAVLRDRYLGPKSDVDGAHDALVQWKAARDETIRLLQAGKRSEAFARQKSTGAEGRQTEALLRAIRKVDDFAKARGERFYRDAEEQRGAMMVRLGLVFGAILLLSVLISYLLLDGIRGPLTELTSAAETYQKGDLASRSRYASANEFGALSASFNSLAGTIQTELQSKESAARIAEVMLKAEELRAVCRELLKALLQHTGSQVGAVYLLNEQKAGFEHFESIGLAAAGHASFSAAGRQGEFGAALATLRIQRITDIAPNTHFTFSTVIGDFTPREIVTIPILSGQDVVAVISLASVRSYSAPAMRLIHDIWSLISARLNGALSLRQLRASAEKLEQQNQELAAQQRELQLQAGELGEQNIELELQKRQLHDANRLKSTFLSNMSHELRTPLNSVIALAGVLSRRLANSIPAEEQDYLEVIERNGKNLLALINNILDLSRVEAGREEISLSRFTVGALAAEVVAMIEPQAREKNVALLNRVARDLHPIRSDLAKCRHILQNLVGNAVKFTKEGTVEISAAVSPEGIKIAVTDTGIGIAAGKLHYIFDEFRQADESTTRSYGGTGLGLSIAGKYATLLRGSIGVESTPGKGSTFTLTLPLTIDAPIGGEEALETTDYSEPAASSLPFYTPDGQSKRILLVEDSEPAVIQLTDILAGHGYRVQVARNGSEALEQIEKELPDAMILDLMMPEMDGFEVLRTIRGTERTAHIPVLILTAKYVTRDELSFLKGNHIHQLIQKGDINKTDLLAAIQKMVSPHRRRPTPARTQTSRRPVILVVEDNPDNMTTARAMLQDAFTVIEAADGQSGIERARTFAPDLILMDLSLPVMDGFKALEAIRNEDALKHVPVIAVTASAMKGNREEILVRGFDGYISKPIDRVVLERTIKENLYGLEWPHDTGD
jgi:signal transduction histidine kinase/DNA-binding response OmpR family regulator/HAMP domain-containing protein